MSATQTPTTSPTAGYSATFELLRNGKRRFTVTQPDGSIVTRTSANPYAFVNLQGWEGREGYAVRFSRNPLPVGRAIEYGRCVGSIPITEAAPQAPAAPKSWCRFPDCIHHH